MQPMLNHQNSEKTPEKVWAVRAVSDLFAGINLNQRLVEDGVWDQYISDMNQDVELSAYGTFLIGLRDSLKFAKRQRGDKSSPKT